MCGCRSHSRLTQLTASYCHKFIQYTGLESQNGSYNSKIVSDLLNLATLAWLGCIRETRSSQSYSVSTAVHPALAAIAAQAGFRGTALVLVQEPVLT